MALSGMSAANQLQQASAHNIANLNTPGFRRQEVVQSTDPSGGVTAAYRESEKEGEALEADVVGQLQAKALFLANLSVFRAQDRMAGALLDAFS